MARKPMVTRTILTTKANVLCMDINSCEPFNKTVVLPRVYKDEQKLMKAVKESVETETIKAVHVVDSTTVETLYGLTEEQFISMAVELDKETRRPIGEEAEVETEDAE